MEFLSKILQKLKPQENWNSFQEEKSINLSKKIRLLIESQIESNKLVKELLSLNNTKAVSARIKEDTESDFLVLGADNALFKKLLNEYPTLYLEYSQLINNLLKGNNLSDVIRSYGIMAVLTNLSSLLNKDILSKESYLEILELIYSPTTIENIKAITKSSKIALNNESRQEIIQLALNQGIVDIFDLAYDEEDANLLRNLVKKNVKIPNDKYVKDRIYNMFDDLKLFLISINREIKKVMGFSSSTVKE